jgi:simple sugar transport system permease protein
MGQTPKSEKPGVSQILAEELGATEQATARRGPWRRALLPLLAIFTGLLVGGIFIAFTTESVYAAFRESLGAGISEAIQTVLDAYGALFSGSIGDPIRIIDAVQSGDGLAIRRAINPIFETLIAATPLIMAGLGVALGFRAGLFNIGAEGQLYVGAICATFVGYSVTGLPAVIHIPLALAAGMLGGGLWGLIPGWLKAKTGGHEVINTIMMNYVAFRLMDWLLRGPMGNPESTNPISPPIASSAYLPQLFEAPIRFHLGFFLALIAAVVVWWFLFKTNWGFTFRTVGANPNAARYAGMNIVRTTVLAMTFSGALAGLAGTNEVMGLNHNLAPAFSSGYGFDAIAIALLGNNHPIVVVLSALLFGMLRTGATRMQVVTAIPVDIIGIVQAMVLAFIAAPAIVRTIYRLRVPDAGEQEIVISSWSSQEGVHGF